MSDPKTLWHHLHPAATPDKGKMFKSSWELLTVCGDLKLTCMYAYNKENQRERGKRKI
jgi:hypothetical protein